MWENLRYRHVSDMNNIFNTLLNMEINLQMAIKLIIMSTIIWSAVSLWTDFISIFVFTKLGWEITPFNYFLLALIVTFISIIVLYITGIRASTILGIDAKLLQH